MVKRAPHGAKAPVKPIDSNRRNELIGAIVEALKPISAEFSSAPIEPMLNHDIDLLIKMIPLQESVFDRQLIRNHTQKIEKAIARLQITLASTPGPVLSLLFPATRDNGVKSADEFLENLNVRIESFTSELVRLRAACNRDYGLHPNYDHAKNMCTEFAHGFIQNLSAEQEVTGTADGSFRTIAGLLYEIVTSIPDADLKRSCDNLINFMNGNL